jgi:hypothetical protein
MCIQHIQGLCQSELSTTDHALSLVAPATTESSHLNGRMLYLRRLQSQSHIATDGQSVSLGIEPHLGLVTRYLLFF